MAYQVSRNSKFEQKYRCYPVSFIDKSHLEKGDKIIMPPSALDRLASMHIDYPMLFELRNPSVERVTHCGVLEFVADEGLVYLPYWMMQNMLIQEGDIVQLTNASLTKGTYVKLQPHSTEFLDITNPKAVLETSLRNYSCLTIGDTILVAYNNKQYFIDIVETKPSSAVSIIETDCEVDFAPPLDYKEPEKPAPCACSNRTPPEAEEESAKKKPKFSPFSGSARRLDGKPSTEPFTPAISPVLKQHQLKAKKDIRSSTASGLPSCQHSGKLVFGATDKEPQNEKPKALPEKRSQGKQQQQQQQKEEEEEEEEPKFQAFTGKKYSLKG